MKTKTNSQKTSQDRINSLGMLIVIVILCSSLQTVNGQEKYENMYGGQRPYELDWAGRYEDDHVPFIDFEKEEAWTVEVRDGSATIRSL